ncbi:MAG: alanine dehydrogenase, partial [Alphaproteobacteria bacterium]
MRIGLPKEIKTHEYRVAILPDGVRALIADGHEVFVETGAGAGAGYEDGTYTEAGATICADAGAVFEAAEMIVKVKEPQEGEIARLGPRHVLFTYLHLAADRSLTENLMRSGCTAVAYETITSPAGNLPLLAPMSAIAGRLSVQAGIRFLEKPEGGPGILLGGIAGVRPAKVVVIGSGVVGKNAIDVAVGLGASVVVIDMSFDRLAELQQRYGGRVVTRHSSPSVVKEECADANLIVGAALVPGAAAPRIVTREMLRGINPDALLVDVSIDQGGCFETSRPTTHAAPIMEAEGRRHYAVANMPGAVPRTASHALCEASLPYVLRLAKDGVEGAMTRDRHF